jgi:mono/diheme cytochrome c family protein
LKTLPLATVVGFFSVVITAVSAQTPPLDETLAANQVFQKHCAKCHGKTAEGRHFGGPSLVAKTVAATSAEELRSIITNGKGRMPKYAGKLTAEEIDALVRQITASNAKP